MAMKVSKHWIYISNAVLLLMMLVVFGVMAMGIIRFSGGENLGPDQGTREVNDGWMIIDDEGQYIEFNEFGERLNVRELTLSRIFIFDNEGENDMLEFYARNCSVEIYQNGYLLHAYEDPGFARSGSMIGDYKVTQKLDVYPGEAAEVVVHMVSCLPYSIVESFTFGSSSSVYRSLFVSSSPTIVVVLATLVMSVLVVMIMSMGRQKGMVLYSYYYFLIFVFFSCLWLMSNADFWGYFGLSSRILSLVSYESFLIMPVVFSIFMYYSVKHYRILDVVSFFVSTAVMVSLNVLHFTGAAIFLRTLYIPMTVFMATIGLAVVQTAIELKDDRSMPAWISCLSFLIVLVGGLVQCYVFVTKRVDRPTLFLLISMMIFMFAHSLSLIRDLFKLVDEGRKAGDYLTMAKTDPLTGLENRRGLEFYIKEIADRTVPFFRVGCIVCDLNGLKKTNDTYGHAVGDQMIKDFANCLSICFENRGVPFRSGGDEFYILFSDVEVDMSAMMRRLMIGIEGSNTSMEYKLSCSSGCYADYVPSHNEGAIWDIIKLADAEMYKQKKKDRELV